MTRFGNSARSRGSFFIKLTSAVGAACLAALIGCGAESPLAPGAEVLPQFTRVQPDVAVSGRGGRAPQAISVTARVGVLGGTVRAGRHTVTFAPGSLLKSTDITVTDMTPVTGYIEAQLFPEGIYFLAPVTLQSNCADLYSPIGMTMYWLDTSNSSWIDINGVPSPDGQGVIAVLQHFSTYRPGKAGW